MVLCDQECEDQFREQITSLKNQLNVYKPLLLALVTTMVCIALWMLVLTMTGKRRDKLRRLLRRDRFLSEVETEESKSEDGDTERADKEEVVAAVPVPGIVRSNKISLPARMTDLYQSYPEDKEGMVVAQTPEIILTRPSISSAAPAEQENK